MILRLLPFVLACLSFISCREVAFEAPVPNDGELIIVVPKEFQGVWVDGFDTLQVNDFTISYVEWEEFAVAKNEVAANPEKYMLSGDKFYRLKDGVKSKAFVYRSETDSFKIRNVSDFHRFDLSFSDYSRLIQLNKDELILNYSKFGEWWTPIYIKKEGSKGTSIYRISKNSLPIINEVVGKEILPKKSFVAPDIKFLPVSLNSSQVKKLIKKGGFDKLMDVLTEKKRIK